MGRLTGRDKEGGAYAYDVDLLTVTEPMQSVIECLAAYEDTGLEPHEIQENLKRLAGCGNASEVYRKALDTYGPEAQTTMVFEEMAELQKELCKHARGKDNVAAIAEEIADVQIMLEQMILLHHCYGRVKIYRDEKLERLAERLEALKDGNA